MVQNFLLVVMVLLCVLLIISIFRKPLEDRSLNPCKFKILSPKYYISGNKKRVCFNIIVEKKHRYFINFPLSFKFYSEKDFKTQVKVNYTTPGEEYPQMILDKIIDFDIKVQEYVVYITDVIMGKITIEVELEIEHGKPIIGFEILENSTCQLTKEHKIELKFPEK